MGIFVPKFRIQYYFQGSWKWVVGTNKAYLLMEKLEQGLKQVPSDHVTIKQYKGLWRGEEIIMQGTVEEVRRQIRELVG